MTTNTDKTAYQAGYQAAQLEASLQAGSPAIPGSAEHWRASYLELSAKFDELLKGRQVLGVDSIRLQHEIEQLRQAVHHLHAAKGRYHTQLATCDLFDLCGLPNERPAK